MIYNIFLYPRNIILHHSVSTCSTICTTHVYGRCLLHQFVSSICVIYTITPKGLVKFNNTTLLLTSSFTVKLVSQCLNKISQTDYIDRHTAMLQYIHIIILTYHQLIGGLTKLFLLSIFTINR